MASGTTKGLGNKSDPSRALKWEHTKWNQEYRAKRYEMATSLVANYDLTAAQLMELCAWLGWLRGNEHFGLNWDDVDYVPPELGKQFGLEPSIGFLVLKLDPATCISQSYMLPSSI
jgi:hypothetical protein